MIMRYEWAWVLIVSICLSILYASFTWLAPTGRYNTPDEVTQSFFARRVARGESLRVPDKLNDIAGLPIIRPRWVHIQDQAIVPVSFLGFPVILGTIGRIIGEGALPYITPLLAIIGLMSFYFLLRDIWGREAAVCGFILLAGLPAYAYYHVRGFFHNALFFDLVLLALWALYKSFRTGRRIYYILTGLAYGVALSIRTAEAYWLTLAGIAWLFMEREAVRWKYWWWILLGISVGLVPVLIFNIYTYGKILAVGYGAVTSLPINSLVGSVGFFTKYVMPFGIHPYTMLGVFFDYIIKFSWWWFGLVVIGFFYIFGRWKSLTVSQKSFLFVIFLSSVWLIIMYGSWQFSDNPDSTAVTIGNSYVRYFLPVYVFGLCVSAVALSAAWGRYWGRVIVCVAMLLYGVFSVRAVVWGRDEGLTQLYKNLWRFETVSRTVQSLTPPGSVIVANGRTDKFFWPERNVIAVKLTEAEYKAIARLVINNIEVYDFHTTYLPFEFDNLNKDLNRFGLYLQYVSYNLGEHSLYKFNSR